MAQVINTNSLSLITQNNINKNQSALSTSMERLSSGLRINSAKDDAAGQAIANRFTSNIKGLTQAARNANDGISVAQTTEGALSEINNNLQRVRELTVQAQNGTNSDSDLTSIQDEIKSRLDEIDRVSGQTQFNGVNVLAKDGQMKIQVGSNDGETISIDLKKIDSSTLGLKGFSVNGNALNVSTAITSVAQDGTTAPAAITYAAGTATTLGVTDTSELSFHNVLDKDGAATGQYVVKSGDNYYSAQMATTGEVTLDTTDVAYTTESGATATQTGVPVKMAYAQGTDTPTAFVTVEGKNYAATTGGTTTVAVGTTAEFSGASSADPLALLDKAIASVDTFRSSLGAVQNRLDSAVTNLNNTTTNLSSAQSRIQDADYATEVSNLSKAQIVQQAGNSVLAKANQVPQQVLSLLQG